MILKNRRGDLSPRGEYLTISAKGGVKATITSIIEILYYTNSLNSLSGKSVGLMCLIMLISPHLRRSETYCLRWMRMLEFTRFPRRGDLKFFLLLKGGDL